MQHIVSYDMNKVLRSAAGSRADPVKILEDRSTIIRISGAGRSMAETDEDVRRYGGPHPREAGEKRRTQTYSANLAAGERPTGSSGAQDPGDGALAQLPSGDVRVGQTWSFDRPVELDRSLGHGTLHYVDTLARIETRGDRRFAIIDVKAAGTAATASDLAAKGFAPAAITLSGSAEYDLTSGLPGVQHYSAHVRWSTRVLLARIGLLFDDIYDAEALTQTR